MPINPPVAIEPNVFTARDIISDALIEIGMLEPGEETNNSHADLFQWAFRKLNYLLDEWAAANIFVYSVGFQVFTLVTGLSPHTIGPGNGITPATFPVTQRPTKIESCSLLLPGTNGQFVDTPVNVEDDDWWTQNPVKTLASTLPTHVYYSPDNPNGSLYFWPVPQVVYQVRLRLWTLLNQFVSITDPVDGPGGSSILPPAYRAGLMLSLAEALQTSGGKTADESLAGRAMRARAALQNNNQEPPRIDTNEGMPSAAQGRRRYNFLTREPW